MGSAVGDGSQRLAGIAGVSSVVLVLASFFIVGEPPAVDAPAAEISTYIVDNRTAGLVSIAMFSLALPLLGLFSVAVRKRLAAFVDEDLATLGLFSNLLFWLVMAFASSIFYGAAWVDGVVETVSPDVLHVLWNVGYVLYMMALPLGALFLAVAAAAGLLGASPKWLAWATVIIAALLLIGVVGILDPDLNLIGLPGILLFIVWTLVTSVIMLRGTSDRP